jgi:hypothetical protein
MDAMKLLQMHLHSEPKRPTEVLPNAMIPPELDEIMMTCMAKFPDQRYDSARQVLSEFESLTEKLFGPQFVKLDSLESLTAGSHGPGESAGWP